MAPSGRQRTFELVPNAPVLGQHPGTDAQPIYSKPPMTTKQAKKLHNQKNKGPKLSKAEQRRIELMEQDRIRKEFEKEKSQARARAAREKKKAKEEKEKDERKRKGLPLVDIHPSQDTISRFISRVGIFVTARRDTTAANVLDSVREEEDCETTTDAGDSGADAGDGEEDGSDKENRRLQDLGAERQAKRPRFNKANEQTSPVSSQRRADPLLEGAQDVLAEGYSRASSVDTDDPINHKLLEAQIIDDLALASSRRIASREANEQRQPISAIRLRPSIKPPAIHMPRAPPKFKSPDIQINQPVDRPRFLPKHLNKVQQRRFPPSPQPPCPPTTCNLLTSTQAFLFDHADELFPSPTQEARELSGDILPDVSKPEKRSVNGPIISTQAAVYHRHADASYTHPGPRPATGDLFDSSCLLTQDFMISTQDIIEMDTPSKPHPIAAARTLLPAVHKELTACVPQAEQIEKSAANIANVPDTVKACVQQLRGSVNGVRVGARSKAAACCPNESLSESRQSQGYKSPCPAMGNQSSPQVTQREQNDRSTTASRPLRSSCQRYAAVAQQQHHSTPDSISNKSTTTAPALNSITTPNNPPPKRRMFGSSGPGPEGLVAMERSYQEMRREERAREAHIRAQDRLLDPAKLPVEELELDLSEFAVELVDDDLGESTGKGSGWRLSGTVAHESAGVQPVSTAKAALHIAASQETDYGDINGDDFDFLHGDVSWLDDDLDDI